MLLQLLTMLRTIEEKIGDGATVEVFTTIDGEGLTFRIRCLIREVLLTWTTTVLKDEISSPNIDFERYLEDRIVYFARLVIAKKKRELLS